MTKTISLGEVQKSSLIILGGMIISAVILFSSYAHAQQLSNIKYPVAELGNCGSQKECMAYCDDKAHMDQCIGFAEKNNLMSKEDAAMGRKVSALVKEGKTPGQCVTREACENYCKGNTDHLNECLSFGEANGLIPPSELAEAKKIAEALKSGAKLPGGCKTKGECENYCEGGSHIDECLSFAEAAGLIPPEQLAEARKVAPFLKSGEMPGKCKTQSECKDYCADNSHFDECISFAEKAGFVNKEEADLAKKTGGVGPGGCKSKDECSAYCADTNHAEECKNYAIEKGLVSKEELEQIKGGGQSIKTGLDKIPPEARGEAESCLRGIFGDSYQDVLDGKKEITKDQGAKVGPCFNAAIGSFKDKMMQKAGAPRRTDEGGGGTSQGGIPEQYQGSVQGGPPSDIPDQYKNMIPAGIPGPGAGGPPAGY